MASLDGSIGVWRGHSNTKIRRKMPSNLAGQMTDGLLPPPLAIRSMLRTATEVGDIGELDILADMRRPRHRLQSTRPRSGSFDTSFASALQYNDSPHARIDRRYAIRYHPATSLLRTRHGMALSNPSAPRFRARSIHRRARTPTILSQRLTEPQSLLHRHRSLTTLRSYAQSKFSDTSSSLYSYRPWQDHASSSSKATPRLSPTTRSHVPTTRRQQSSTSSSILNVDRGCTPSHNYIHSRSAPSPLQLPSPVVSVVSASVREIPAHLQARTPKSTFTQHSRLPSDIQRGSCKELATPMTGRSVPQYYDYSEPFTEQDHLSFITKHCNASNSQTDIVSNAKLRCPWSPMAADQFQTGSAALPAELPTEYNRRTSGQLEVDSELNVFELEATEMGKNATLLTQEPPDRVQGEITDESIIEHFVHQQHRPQRSSVISFRSTRSSRASSFFPNGEKGQRDLTTLVARIHSPERGVSTKNATDIADRDGGNIDEVQASFGLRADSDTTNSVLNHSHSPGPQFLPATDQISMDAHIAEHDELQSAIGPRPHRLSILRTNAKFERFIEAAQEIAQTPFRPIEPNVGALRLSTHDHIPMTSISEFHRGELNRPKDVSCTRELTGKVTASKDKRTSRKVICTVAVPSYGTSTIDSLLDKHIESLGLMPEPESPCDYSNQQDLSLHDHDHDNAYIGESTKDIGQDVCGTQFCPLDLLGRRAFSLDSKIISDLKLSKSLMSVGRRHSVASGLDPASTSLQQMEAMIDTGKPSSGWQTLPSTSREQSQKRMSKLSLASGYMADIDTKIRSLTAQTWSYSQYTLPTSADGAFNSQILKARLRRRSWDAAVEKQQAQAKRRMGVHVKHQMLRGKSDDLLGCVSSPNILAIHTTPSLRANWSVSMQPPLAARHLETHHIIELDGNALDIVDCEAEEYQLNNERFQMLSRWSKMIAAMPLPSSSIQKLTRKASSKTQRSQESQRSYQNIVKPLNNSRQRAQAPELLDIIPRSAPPDLGPPLETSTLNLSVPYTEMPSTICPSPQNGQSFFEYSPTRSSRDRCKPRRGLRSLRSVLYGSRAASLPLELNTIRYGAERQDVIRPDRVKRCRLFDNSKTLHSGRTANNCADRKQKIVKRLKEWCKIACCSCNVNSTRTGTAARKTLGEFST